MGRIRHDQRLTALVLLIAMVVTVALTVASGSLSSWLFAAAILALGWWVFPGRRGRHTPHQQAWTEATDDDVIVYWRPG